MFHSLARTLDSGLASTLAQLEGLGETDRCSTATSGVSMTSKQTTKRNKRGENKPDQENKNMLNAQKTKARGLQAMEKIMTERDVKDFEQKMKKV